MNFSSAQFIALTNRFHLRNPCCHLTWTSASQLFTIDSFALSLDVILCLVSFWAYPTSFNHNDDVCFLLWFSHSVHFLPPQLFVSWSKHISRLSFLTPSLSHSLFPSLFLRCSVLVSVWYRAHKEREAGGGAVSRLAQGHHAHQDAGDECEWGMW